VNIEADERGYLTKANVTARLHLACWLRVTSLVARSIAAADGVWPQWRGPLATGVAPGAEPPLRWSEAENVRWKVELPGRGHGSPIVWKDRVFVTTAVPSGDAGTGDGGGRGVAPSGALRFTVLALDRRSGETVWQRVAREEAPHEGTHTDGSWASPSPLTDGERVYASFGSRGLYAYDFDGGLVWSVDLGDMATRLGFGEGASPALAGDLLIVNWDHEGDSFVVALDKRTGEERWRRQRDEVTSWATPLVVEHGGRLQVVVSATGRVRSYDAESGETLWEAGGQTVNVIPSPVHADGLVYATSGFRGCALVAIRLDAARGDVSHGDAVAWSYDRDTPYVPSPLLHDGQLYVLKVNSGIVTSFDAATGEILYGPQRLPGIDGIYASPVAARDRIYFLGRNGTTTVVRSGPDFEVLVENDLDDDFSASPALAGDEIFRRGYRYLYCLAETGPGDEPAAGGPGAGS
jgi:outer membrane protein assembly factor BamB